MRVDVLGVGFDDVTVEGAVKSALEIIDGHRAAYAVTPNPEIVWMCRDDASLKQAVSEAAMVLPDGIGIILGAKVLGTPLQSKVPGIDFASQLMCALADKAGKVFLFGAKPGIAEKAAENLKAMYPGLEICGTADGYFSDDAPIIEKINAARPDLLLVCLGAPKQENWMRANAGKLDIGLMIGLGGSLDVFAGEVKRAPESFQKYGLEWLYRLIKEPKRITRMAKLPLFMLACMGQRIRGNKNAG